MDPLALLGKNFDDVKDSLTHSGVLEAYENLEEGEEQEYYVSAPDNSWEFLLEKGNSIKTIFLYLDNGSVGFGGVSTNTTRDELISIFGKPSRQGEIQEFPDLGLKGAWERYDFENYSLHIEHDPHSDHISMLTIMVPSAVP